MTRILLVDNDPDWLELISRSLPGYQVDQAATFGEALERLQSGAVYDVAIVDLNLTDSANRNLEDLLGGEVLHQLRRDHPSTVRIALTAWPPSAIRAQVFDRYDVDELLIKTHLSLANLRDVVQSTLDRTLANLPADARAMRSELWEDFRNWEDDQVRQMRRQKRTLQDRLRIADLTLADGGRLGRALAAIEQREEAFGLDCSRAHAILAAITCAEDIPAASAEIDTLKRKFETE